MTPEQIAASLSPGAARAVMAMTGDWRKAGYGAFAWNDAVEAVEQGLVELSLTSFFRLTPLGQQVKDVYLGKGVADTVVTTEVDGVPHRVLRTEFVEELLKSRALGRMTRALKNAIAFQYIPIGTFSKAAAAVASSGPTSAESKTRPTAGKR